MSLGNDIPAVPAAVADAVAAAVDAFLRADAAAP